MNNLNDIVSTERRKPLLSAHNTNSYLTNLPVEEANLELKAILKYFQDPDTYLPLYQKEEFVNGLSIEARMELIDDKEKAAGIVKRESLYHSHDFFEMMYVYDGSCRNWISSKERICQKGDLLLYNLQTVHKLLINEDSVVFNILISKEILMTSFLDLLQSESSIYQFYINSLYNIPSENHILFHLEEECDTKNILHSLILEYVGKKPFYEKVMRIHFSNLLIHLTRLLEKNETMQAQFFEGIDINAILEYIHANYQTVTLQSLSDHFGYSPRSMMRIFKKVTKRTFSDIIREYRMLAAINYLRNTQISIDDIALRTGFSERAYFDKVFKQSFKLTPHEYRQLIQHQ